MFGLLLALASAAPVVDRDPGLVLPPQRKGAIIATLSLRVPEKGPGPGRGRVQLTLHVRGPESLDVEGPQLEDALAGWQVRWATSSWSSSDSEADWEQDLELVQIKPGVVPLPGVTLRVREGRSASWEEIGWPDLLAEPRDVPGPEKLPPLPPSPWPRVALVLVIVLIAVCGLALLVRAGRRWRAAGERPLLPHQRALAKLEAIPEEPAAGVLHLDAVLRGYLEERFGLEAMRKTTHELLASLAEKNEFSSERLSNLSDLLGWCDVAKFAGGSTEKDVRVARERTVLFVRATSPGERETDTKERKPGENQIPEQGG
jgi:hypothetical protein